MLHVIAWNDNNNNNDDDMSIFIVIIVIICRFSAPCQIQLTMRRIRSWLIFFFISFIHSFAYKNGCETEWDAKRDLRRDGKKECFN